MIIQNLSQDRVALGFKGKQVGVTAGYDQDIDATRIIVNIQPIYTAKLFMLL